MAAAKLPITIEQATTFELPLTFTNDQTGNPIDVSLWIFSGQVRSTYSAANPAIASFVFTSGATSNQVIASLSKTVTAAIPVNTATAPNLTPTTYVYDITALKPDTTVQRILEGAAIVTPTVSR